MENETCPANETCDNGEFTPGELTCPYYSDCFDVKLWEDYWEKYRNSPKGKAEELRRQQQEEDLDLDDIPF